MYKCGKGDKGRRRCKNSDTLRERGMQTMKYIRRERGRKDLEIRERGRARTVIYEWRERWRERVIDVV